MVVIGDNTHNHLDVEQLLVVHKRINNWTKVNYILKFVKKAQM